MEQAIAQSTSPRPQHPSLRHILVVGGRANEWNALADDEWRARVSSLGSFCNAIGVPWLTIRAYEPSAELADERVDSAVWCQSAEHCDVIVDPRGDGRQRFADAMNRLEPGDEVNEATVAATLYEPADCEPDLVVVLGPPTQLPPSLVWELAYAELVFLPVDWVEFSVDDLADAITDFSNRRRRFGGLDE